MALGGGGVLGLAVVYHGFRGNHRSLPLYNMALVGGGGGGLGGCRGSCRCISWL